MTNRRFRDAGFEPMLAYIILIVGFIALSVYLFYKTTYAEYLYLVISLSLTGKLSETRRNEFLKICLKNSELRKIRITENMTAAMPFFIFLLYRHLFIAAAILLLLTVLLALTSFRTNFTMTIPTPFYKKPFEFTVGFRNTFYLFPAAYVLACIAASIGNFNLGIFSMLLVFAVTLSYYTKPEDEYYVWSYKLMPVQFLLEKIKTAILYSSLLVLPVILILGISFYGDIANLLLFVLAGYAFLVCIITAKYSAYPGEINIIQGILIAFSLYFPPILVAVIPYFFFRSVSRLNTLLR